MAGSKSGVHPSPVAVQIRGSLSSTRRPRRSTGVFRNSMCAEGRMSRDVVTPLASCMTRDRGQNMTVMAIHLQRCGVVLPRPHRFKWS